MNSKQNLNIKTNYRDIPSFCHFVFKTRCPIITVHQNAVGIEVDHVTVYSVTNQKTPTPHVQVHAFNT